jgi:hypothetical protein
MKQVTNSSNHESVGNPVASFVKAVGIRMHVNPVCYILAADIFPFPGLFESYSELNAEFGFDHRNTPNMLDNLLTAW